ncbi:hypothetical protein ACIRPQ_17630 [Streptomyces sp. NPDC101213]|uniref:hypothetical protein n=1 Tax=unclassified Streptomyces TaxID=2593676 RepID=UPI0036F7C96F
MEEPEGTAEPEAGPAGREAAAPRPRRRGRTTLLIAAAAALGVVAGTCTGYLVQAGREPTKLPPLSQPVLTQAKGPGPEPLSAAQDRRLRTDGDLRKLLLKKPKGAKDAEWLEGLDGWMDMSGYAGLYEEPDDVFPGLVEDEFRRAAVTGWSEGETYTVEIRLVQFRQEELLGAADYSDNNQHWADEEAATDSWDLPGTGDGMVYVHRKPETEPGYLPVHTAEAHAWRGDVTVEIWVSGTKAIPKNKIMDLARRQMEQL